MAADDSSGSLRLLDLYHLGRQLGRGSSGVIRLCTCLSSGHTFACKSIPKTSSLLLDSRISDFRKEVDAMSRLSRPQQACYSDCRSTMAPSSHRNVVRLHQVLEDEDQVHLVMELCLGGDLFDRLQKKRRFSEAEAARVIKNLMVAVQSCHSAGILHRDIKLENILFVDESPDSCDIRLVDFGMSEFFKPGDTFTSKVGTPYYVSPEVLQGPSYSEQVDVWSSGVVLYMLLSGEPPFWGPTDRSIWNSIVYGQLSFHQKSWKDISSSAKNLISEMLCKDPGMRMTPSQVLQHPWILQNQTAPPPATGDSAAAADYKKQRLMDTNLEIGAQMKQMKAM